MAALVYNLRPAGVEPTFPASEADALSIELRARKAFLLFYQNLVNCAFKFRISPAENIPLSNLKKTFGAKTLFDKI